MTTADRVRRDSSAGPSPSVDLALVSRPPALPAQRPPAEVDATDERILALLCEDGRMSMRTVALRAGVSRASAYARVQRLREVGVVLGVSVRLDPERLGLRATAHIQVTVEQGCWREALVAFRAMPAVVYCAALAADHDVLLVVRAPDVAAIRDVVLEQLHQRPEVLRTRTLLVLDELTATDGEVLSAALLWSRDRPVI